MVTGLIRIGIGMVVIPTLLGMLYTYFTQEEKNNFIWNIAAGYILAFGIFEILVLPLIFMRKSLSCLLVLYGSVILLFTGVSVFLNKKRIGSMLLETAAAVRSFTFNLWAELFVIVLQCIVYLRYEYSNADDSFFVAAATTAISTDTILAYSPYTGNPYETLPARYVLSPWYALMAVISKVTNIPPAILAHTVYMIVFVLLAYGVYALIGRRLFGNDMEKCGYFLMLLSAAFIFSAYSTKSSGLVFLIRLWQGKAVLAGVLLPLLLYLLLRIYFLEGGREEYLLLGCLMSACCMVSTMGVMLGAVMTGIFGLLTAVRKRKIKYLLCMGAACLPNVICGLLYLSIR